MDVKESMEAVASVKKKFNFRQLFMAFILIFATAADILIDYVRAGFDASIFYEASYWIMLGITCLSTVFVVLTTRDFFREKELRENPVIVETQRLLDLAHAELLRRNLATRFEEYVNEVNAERKRRTYRAYLQYKLSKAKKEKQKAKWRALLETADKDILFLPTRGNVIRFTFFRRIHFHRLRIATIFARSEIVDGDDEDIETHEQRHVSGLIFKKVAMLMAFSMAFSTLFFQPGEFSVAILVNTFTKLFRTVMSVMLGATDGQDFARGTILSKMRLRLDFIQKFLEAEKAKASSAPVEAAENAAE